MTILPKSITNVLNRRGKPMVPHTPKKHQSVLDKLDGKKQYTVTGTDVVDGDPEHDVFTEYADSLANAIQQAELHVRGTSFKIEKVELSDHQPFLKDTKS